MEDYKYLFKVVLIGNAGVGKTCLVRRFTQGLFPPGQGATIGVDFMIKTVEVEGEKVKMLTHLRTSATKTGDQSVDQPKDKKEDLQIWDTAGQERFRSITQSYYHSANALILVYDVCCQTSFESLPQWLREIEMYASTKVLAYLVGNKTDQINKRELPTHVGQQFAERYEMKFLETSAKEADNVERLFMDIARDLTKQAREHDLKPEVHKPFPSGGSTPISSTFSCCNY